MKVIIPTALRKFTDELREIEFDAQQVDDALKQLVEAHPLLSDSLFDENGELVGSINVFVNDRNVRDLDQGATPLVKSDEILLVPAIAGG